ncbi:hypothetical protein [Streptomyces mirabilis]|uniref:hypothetical protein n=1 Tax=Streptomyces mirabilis TaxID=68239 RepID=UPI00224EA21B|nr:hypothetical protein [Streptomyces mirabilis]MCX4426181.1 hypothetical protein [Streptomyces mirabilis]
MARVQQCATYGRFGVFQETPTHGVRQRTDLRPVIVGPLGSACDGGPHKLKAWRGIATRYDKTPDSYSLASTCVLQ